MSDAVKQELEGQAARLAALMAERYEARYGVGPGKAEVARLEVEFLRMHDPRSAPLRNVLAEVEAFKGSFPAEWSRRKPWLNPPRSHDAKIRTLISLVGELPKAWRRTPDAQAPAPDAQAPVVSGGSTEAATAPVAP